MQRIPEPEVLMDDAEQAQAYAMADFNESNSNFVQLFAKMHEKSPLTGPVVDLGCGPADICFRLADSFPELQIDAVDGAEAMLTLARRELARQSQLANRIRLVNAMLPCQELPAGHYSAVISNSLLHHLEDPQQLWQAVRHLGKPGAGVLIMDLARPYSEIAVDALVETYARDETELLRRDFRNSLFAAYRMDEVEQQLSDAGINGLRVRQTTDRHWVAAGWLR